MPILWILTGIIAVILILLIIPLRAHIYNTPEFTVKAGYGIIKIDVLKFIDKFNSKKEKKDTENKKKAKAELKDKEKQNTEKKSDAKKEDTESFAQKLTNIKEFISSAAPAVKFLLNHIVLVNIYLDMKISGEDACETAVNYGKMNALCASVYAVIKNVFKVKRCRVFITPDFTAEQSDIKYDVKASVLPLYIIGALAVFFIDFLKNQLNNPIKEKENISIQNGKADKYESKQSR